MAINLVERDLVQLTFAPLQRYRIKSFIFIQKVHSLHISVNCTYVLSNKRETEMEIQIFTALFILSNKGNQFLSKIEL